jgi:hypothetical protein
MLNLYRKTICLQFQARIIGMYWKTMFIRNCITEDDLSNGNNFLLWTYFSFLYILSEIIKYNIKHISVSHVRASLKFYLVERNPTILTNMSFKIQVLRIEYLIVQAIFDLVFELASSYLNLEFNWDGYKDYFEFL